MTNAKDELTHYIGESKILCAEINLEEHSELKVPANYFSNPLINLEENEYGDREVKIRLFPNYSITDWENFLQALDFLYDSGYGGQRLFGIVWMQDGTWLSRGEYDGSEWWEWNRLPELPIDFQREINIENIIKK